MRDDQQGFSVVWPLAPVDRRELVAVDRPGTLEGKRVAFLWDYIFRGDKMFDVIELELRSQFPSIEIIGFDEFGDIQSHDEHILRDLPDRLRKHRVDAAIVGVGA
jgi:hypothetical protein